MKIRILVRRPKKEVEAMPGCNTSGAARSAFCSFRILPPVDSWRATGPIGRAHAEIGQAHDFVACIQAGFVRRCAVRDALDNEPAVLYFSVRAQPGRWRRKHTMSSLDRRGFRRRRRRFRFIRQLVQSARQAARGFRIHIHPHVELASQFAALLHLELHAHTLAQK